MGDPELTCFCRVESSCHTWVNPHTLIKIEGLAILDEACLIVDCVLHEHGCLHCIGNALMT